MRDNDDKCANCACAFFNSSYEGNCQGEINGGPAIISCKEFEPEYSQPMKSPNRPPSCDKLECQCDMRTKLVGDGCAICNPELYADLCRDNDKPKLKECPFCEHESPSIQDSGKSSAGYYFAYCPNCNAEGTGSVRRDIAIEAWNYPLRRSGVAELLRLVDEAIISTPTPAEERLQTYADKLRKEWEI